MGKQQLSQPLKVEKDPHSGGSLEDIQAQTQMLLEIKEHVKTAVKLIDEIESERKQLEDLSALLKTRPDGKELTGSASALEKKLMDLEGHFFDLRLTSARQDTLRWPRRLYAKLVSLAGYASGTDMAPTKQELEVLEKYRKELSQYQLQMRELRDKEIGGFNQRLRQKDIGNIVIAGTPQQ